jgi:hypothetical protein
LGVIKLHCNQVIQKNRVGKMISKRENLTYSKFNRDLLPSPGQYYRDQGLKIKGGAEWKSSICPFHSDKNPSLRLRIDSGCFRCMACGAKGGDILAFHMKRYGLNFVQAVKDLGAWEDWR